LAVSIRARIGPIYRYFSARYRIERKTGQIGVEGGGWIGDLQRFLPLRRAFNQSARAPNIHAALMFKRPENT